MGEITVLVCCVKCNQNGVGISFCGMGFKKRMPSLIWRFIIWRNSRSRTSISLLSLIVRHDGSDPVGLNLRSLGFGISMHSFQRKSFLPYCCYSSSSPCDLFSLYGVYCNGYCLTYSEFVCMFCGWPILCA